MDVLILSRIQFALNIMFHYLYPPISIGLGLMLVIMEGTYLRTKKEKYKVMTQFWIKIFALTFALGVATGMVQAFAFGTNWARYSRFVGDVFGSALAMIAFGFSTSYAMALGLRILGGLLNGTMGIAKTVVAELTDKTNRSAGFSMIGFVTGLGFISMF